MHLALRRSAVILASTAVVLGGAPLLDSAFAASTLTQSSVTPASSPAVKDSHPTISASYTDNSAAANLDSSSTIAVTKGETNIGCTGVVSGNTITCNYSGLLTDGTYTITIHAVEAANTANTADNTSNFTVDVPSIKPPSSPAANALVGVLPNGKVQVQYDAPIDDTHSTISVQQIADRQSDGSYAPSSHTPLTPAAGSPTFTVGKDGSQKKLLSMADSNQNDTIVFTPSSQPVNKGIYQVTLDVFGTDGAGNGTTTPDGPNLKAENKDSFTFTLDNTPPPVPTNLSAPTINIQNQTAVPFTGKAKPGTTIVVDLTDNLGSPHVNNAGSSNGGPVTVSPCDESTTSCPWTVTLKASGSLMKDTTTGSWTATASNGVASATSDPVAIIKDTTPPAGSNVAGSFPNSPTMLHVTGGSDSTVDHYTLDIHNTANASNKLPTIVLDKTANGGVAANGTFVKDVDVSSLDDGSLTVTIVAIDQYGNAASATNNSATIDKESGLQLMFGSSFFTLVNSDTPSFTEVLARHNHALQKPSQLAVEFSNPIALKRLDTGPFKDTPSAGAHDIAAAKPTFVEVLPNGSDGNVLQGDYAKDANDSRRLLVTPPTGLADGAYKVHISLWEAGKCDYADEPPPPAAPTQPDYDPDPCASQWTYDDYIKVPNTTTPFIFTVDTHAPTGATITTIPAGSIDGSNVGDVVVKGTGEAGSLLTLTAKSSGGGSVLALNQGQPVTVGDDGKWSEDEDSAALAVLPDGNLTITGTPSDSAGNTGTAVTDVVTLAARPSIPRSLALSVTSTSFTLHWVAPSYDGYPAVNGNAISHLTGYRYTYQDTTANAVDTTVHSVNVTSPGATSATQGNLLTGHSYAVTLCALNNVSGPCNTVNTTATPAYVTSLTAKVSKAIVVYGNPITLSGRLTRPDLGAGIANKPVNITPRFDNGKTGTVIHVTTNSLGNWSVKILKPAKNALYLVSFNATHADPLYQPSNSAVRSLVAVSVRIDKVTSRSSSHTYPVTLTGHVSPNQSGRVVNIYAKLAGSAHYQRIGGARISSTSTWTFTRTFGKGKFYVYANFASQNGNVGANSPVVTFTRT
jgi:hypothetical protein